MPANFVQSAKSALIDKLGQFLDEVGQLAQPFTDAERWTRPMDPANSIGHLVLHLTGNLHHFVGGQLGKTGYVRDREKEFTEDRLPCTLCSGTLFTKLLFGNLLPLFPNSC